MKALRFIIFNFAVPIVFFLTFQVWGAKVAIGFSVGIALIQLLIHWAIKQAPSLFFIIAATFTIGFGGIDLFITNPKFFRLEPFAQNMIMGTIFFWTTFTDIPILGRFIDALPTRARILVSDGLTPGYLKKLT